MPTPLNNLSRLLIATFLLTATAVSHATMGHVTQGAQILKSLKKPLFVTAYPSGDTLSSHWIRKTGLEYFGAGDYDPVLGRFMGKGVDPSRFQNQILTAPQ